jgi:hypothetical protein
MEGSMSKTQTAASLVALLGVGVMALLGHPRASDLTRPSVQEAQEETSGALPASLAGFEDRGKFRIYVNEEPMAEILFSWSKPGLFEHHDFEMAGQSVTMETNRVRCEDPGPASSRALKARLLTRTGGTVSDHSSVTDERPNDRTKPGVLR